MHLTEKDFEFMLECQERDIATILAEEQKMTIHQALDLLYGSHTYDLLKNPNTGLYFQSPRYVFSYLKDENNWKYTKHPSSVDQTVGGNEVHPTFRVM